MVDMLMTGEQELDVLGVKAKRPDIGEDRRRGFMGAVSIRIWPLSDVIRITLIPQVPT